jgi:hypothetical protein
VSYLSCLCSSLSVVSICDYGFLSIVSIRDYGFWGVVPTVEFAFSSGNPATDVNNDAIPASAAVPKTAVQSTALISAAVGSIARAV